MPATQEISESLVRENITRAVADVFQTMLGKTARLSLTATPARGASWPPRPTEGVNTPQLVGTVGFLGELNGLIYIYFPLEFARSCTAQLLGMSDAELHAAGDEVVYDAIGELTNMSVGSFKNGLCDAGYPCMLTIPSILRGANFCVEPISSAQRYTYCFELGDYKVVTDILVKAAD